MLHWIGLTDFVEKKFQNSRVYTGGKYYLCAVCAGLSFAEMRSSRLARDAPNALSAYVPKPTGLFEGCERQPKKALMHRWILKGLIFLAPFLLHLLFGTHWKIRPKPLFTHVVSASNLTHVRMSPYYHQICIWFFFWVPKKSLNCWDKVVVQHLKFWAT